MAIYYLTFKCNACDLLAAYFLATEVRNEGAIFSQDARYEARCAGGHVLSYSLTQLVEARRELVGEESQDSVLIFLDFDGVLNRTQTPPCKLDADCLSSFERTIRELPYAEIVISSAWRDAFSLREMRGLFSPDIAARVIDVTPPDGPNENHTRYKAVLAYLKQSGRERDWIAIDDDPLHYPMGLENLLLVDGGRGFDDAASERLFDMARTSDTRE